MTTLASLFAAQAQRTPDAVALADAGGDLTYAELLRQARAAAGRLRALGVGSGDPVAVFGTRGPGLAVALVGVQMAGGACLPLDPAQPAQRLVAMIEAAAPRLLIVAGPGSPPPFGGTAVHVDLLRQDNAGAARDGNPGGALDGASGPESLAYVLFTSGSTGEPKGVMLPQRSLVHHADAVARLYDLGPGDRVLQFASIGFDVSIEELFPTWATGAALVPRPDDLPILGSEWLRWLQVSGITVMNLPTAYWHEWVRDLDRLGEPLPSALRLVIAGGEQPLASAYRAWQVIAGSRVRWINAYGPAETGPIATAFEPPRDRPWPADRELPLGRPVGEATVRVVTAGGRTAATGDAGELWIGGPGLALGYLHSPELTAEHFVADPEQGGARVYRTGDLVRVAAGGDLEFVGRSDDQVKIRGFRVETREVERVLARHAAVAQTAVVAREVRPGDVRLVAYVVPAAGEPAPAGALRRHVADSLPAQMVPASIVFVDRLPLNAHGKVDRAALPAATPPAEATGTPGRPPTPSEAAIGAIWSRVLGVDGIGLDENFFDLGGHSLQATQVIAAVRDELGSAVGVTALFETPTIAELAAAVDAADGRSAAPPPLRATARGHGERSPLSLSQEHMWRLERTADPPGLYNITALHRFTGAVDVRSLELALALITRRHETLRVRFHATDPPQQSVADVGAPALTVQDLHAARPERRDAELQQRIVEQDAAPFDVERAPLWRATLFVTAANASTLAVTLDHLICDGTSAYILLSEVTSAYESFAAGSAPSLRDLHVQYLDFARWQREWFTEERLRPQLDYWRRTLAGVPMGPGLQFDHTPERPSRRISVHRLEVAGERYRGLEELARRTRSTRFVVTVAAVQALLSIRGGRTDVVVSTTLSGRGRAELDGLIGSFHGVGRIRTDLRGDPRFDTLIARTRESVVGLFEHQDVPFLRIRQAVLPDLPPPGPMLLRAVPVELQYFHTAHDEWTPGAGVVELPGADPGPDSLHFRGHMHPLLITMLDDGERLRIELSYKTDFYDQATIEALGDALQRILSAVVVEPGTPLSSLAALVDDGIRDPAGSGVSAALPIGQGP